MYITGDTNSPSSPPYVSSSGAAAAVSQKVDKLILSKKKVSQVFFILAIQHNRGEEEGGSLHNMFPTPLSSSAVKLLDAPCLFYYCSVTVNQARGVNY